MESEMLTEMQVAERLAISVHTLNAWRQRGEGPPFIKLGRAVRYRADALEEWVKQREIQTR